MLAHAEYLRSEIEQKQKLEENTAEKTQNNNL